MGKQFTRQHLLAVLSLCLLPLLLSAQRITSFTPLTGRVGAAITITGTGFSAVAASNIVYFGSTKAVVNSATATQLVVQVPAGASYKPISVTTGGLTAYSARPFISTFGCSPVAFNGTSLANKISLPAGFFSSPASTAVADFDGDGKPDIAVTNQDASSISVFRNITSSSKIDNNSFAAPVSFSANAGPAGIVAGDFDGDGKLDIAITSTIGIVSVYKNTSVSGVIDNSSFAARVNFLSSAGPSDSAASSNISLGDLDGDGKPDLAVSNSNKGTISLFRNTTSTGVINSSAFAPKVDLATGSTNLNPIGLALTDIDGEGRLDIVVNNAAGLNFCIFRNISSPGSLTTGSFGSRVDFTFGTEFGTTNLVAGDLNNDGKPELVITNIYDNSISVYQNNATAGIINTSSFLQRVNFTTPINPINATISDLNGDGKPDIAVMSYDITSTNSLSNPLSIFANTISGTAINSGAFMAKVDYITGGSFGNIGIADFDADGKPDIAIPNYSSDMISIFKNSSSIYNSLPPATVNGLNTVCDDGVWKHFYDPANTNRILCSIRDNGNNLGTTNARVYVDGTPVRYNTTYFMSRHYLVNPSNQPTGNIQMRLYFTQGEFNAIQAADGRITSPEDLSITRYDGPTADGVFNPSDASSLTIIPPSAITYGLAYGGYYADFTVNSLSEFWFNYGNVVLPVQLLYFKAEKNNSAVSLQWSTASETNSDNFTVERSSDGTGYTAIATVKAAGLSSQSRLYEAKDLAPLPGLNYYRLKQTDKDGLFSYSAVKTVDWNESPNTRVVIAPLPITSRATVSFYARAGTTTLTIYDIRGAAVQSYQLSRTTNGNAQLVIQKDRLTPGMYFYKIANSNQEMYHGKLIVE